MSPSPTAGFRDTTGTTSGTGVFPRLVVVEGGIPRNLTVKRSPFTVGRKADRDIVIADARVSREHAEIVSEEGKFFVVDLNSRHGTFVNGHRVQRHKLQGGDRLEFGVRESVYVVFQPGQSGISPAREFLDQLPQMHVTDVNDMEKLTIFLEAARKLNSAGVLDEILVTLLDTTLKLAQADRAFVFLYEKDRTLRLAAGRNSSGMTLVDDATISHSILADALRSNSEFLLTDNSQSMDFSERQSIVAYDLRTIVCLPLRKRKVQTARDQNTPATVDASKGEVLGALYLDSRSSRAVSAVSHDILRAIATEATSVVESAHLVEAEESSRRYQQELSIAASIQQGLMAVTIPDVPFARLTARNLSCSETGGDFYDAVRTEDKLAVVIADVCGKGVSAALLASTLQGMLYSHLAAGMPLADTVSALNRFLTQKRVGEKYATMFIARIDSDGMLEYVNCGHVLPLIISRGGPAPQILRPNLSNLPVGLIPGAVYECGHARLAPNDRLILVTDGVTEAENSAGEFFDNLRLEEVAATSCDMEDIFSAIAAFRGTTPLTDDCTVVDLLYTGAT
jgi:serine phosphatase RsbU (regulator of sigma subunit)/pSer/pThr/pTyr-binding forkhead associated (FHA) protein